MIWALMALACRQSMVSSAPVPDKVRPEYVNQVVGDYGRLLAKVVTRDGYVDYDALEADREPLDAYVALLGTDWPGRIGKDWHGRYLNAYNALTMFQVLERGRPDSVRDVDGWLPVDGAGFFFETAFRVNGEWLSLSEIEHERVRQLELDLRDHAALNCASMSCPPLRAELYEDRGPGLKRQLHQQMERWMNDDERGVRFEGDEVVFSPIFDWFKNDFHFFSAGLDPCAIAAQYTDGERRRRLEELSAKGCPRRYFEYDWSLNDASRRP